MNGDGAGSRCSSTLAVLVGVALGVCQRLAGCVSIGGGGVSMAR